MLWLLSVAAVVASVVDAVVAVLATSLYCLRVFVLSALLFLDSGSPASFIVAVVVAAI